MKTPPAPVARPFDRVEHGVVRPDPWAWLADTDAPEVVAHLHAERAFYEASVAHLQPLRSALTSEMSARVSSVERSPVWRRWGHYYYTEQFPEREHPTLFRRDRASDGADSSEFLKDSDESVGEPILDFDSLGDDSGFLEMGLTIVSPDERLLAYSIDTTGDEVYELRFRDLDTGSDLTEIVPRTYYGGAWSADSRHFFYTVHDAAFRPHQVWRHEIGRPVSSDVLVLEEADASFEFHLRGTRSGAFIVILAESRTTSETWVVDAAAPLGAPVSVGGRRAGVIYRVEHQGDALLVLTNDRAPEFQIMQASLADISAWQPLRPEDPTERPERVDAFATHVVLTVRRGGARCLRVLPVDDLSGEGLLVTSRHPGGAARLARSTAYDATAVIVVDEAHVQPPRARVLSLADSSWHEGAATSAPGHDPSSYLTEVRTFPSLDGTLVPATLVRHRDTPLDGSAPAVIYAYGAYEYTYEPEFDRALPSLLDRGVVYVHAHVRGGGEGGRAWWLNGRLEHKQKTFDDLCAVATGLAGLVDASRICTRGLSAGGLLQGAVLSQRPELWRAVVAEVPFVDVVTTMLDASIPLTINEWEEWGDPRREADHAWLLAYSPYDNLPPTGGRPDLLVTGALHDPRVMVHEPAKWVAALRASDPAWAPRCLFRCEVGAGAHTGPSGTLGHLSYEAEVYAWLLERMGLS